ncbi:putative tetratricopeptide-like helical domain superfamily [Helianthus annuus]|nr:putative tetratricopeptide-like helical domain superfamily [Helianthus annuus]
MHVLLQVVFTAASALGDCFGGKQGHTVTVKLGRCDDIFVGSSLLNMYCKAGLVEDARKVFDEMPERNSISWATMISGYSMQRICGEALELFRELVAYEEAYVNEFVVTSILSAFTLPEYVHIGSQIHCLGLKHGLLSHVSVGNAIVTMYSKLIRNSITWSAMITGYAQGGDHKKALELFSKMHFNGLVASEFTLVGVLNACSEGTAIGEGKEAHAYSIKLGFQYQIYIMTAVV